MAHEYGSDEYLLQKWKQFLCDLEPYQEIMVARMLENLEARFKTPLQLFVEAANRDFDDEE